jgi:hypothetical protein
MMLKKLTSLFLLASFLQLGLSRVRVELERVGALELLGMSLAHLNVAEARVDVSPRLPLLMAIRDKLARALQEES